MKNSSPISYFVSLSFGLVFVLLAIPLIGMGSAIYVPPELIDNIVIKFPVLTAGLVEFITIGLPVGVLFFIMTYLLSRFYSEFNVIVMSAPFVIFMFSSLMNTWPSQDAGFFLLTACFKSLPVLIVAIYLYRCRKIHTNAKW